MTRRVLGSLLLLIEEMELLRDIYVAEQQLAKDGGIPHDEAKEKVLARIRQ